VLDIDVQSYFDSIDWELLLKAVRHRPTTSPISGAGLRSIFSDRAAAPAPRSGNGMTRTQIMEGAFRGG